MKEPTPLQEAKRLGVPYVKLTINERHAMGTALGCATVESPVSAETAKLAHDLLKAILDDAVARPAAEPQEG